MAANEAPTSTRVDSWLWAVRLYKTRSQATTACRAGHVRVNGARAKPAQAIKVGDQIVVRGGPRERTVDVARILTKRVGAPVAAQAMIDHTPAPPPPEERPAVPRREKGSGRPTKKERRQLDRLRGR
ncbi:MAG TPA: RNA-binding S4 domain-containing protein [Jiangellaceae bacterium]|nr:RNA-binding S4 domain-containing protein [Jiangellaceae bacterium]